ncbi:MAG: putative glycosyl transferase, partial [Marmoricola sp.]|nr:putative glycosyl transferase [Marmoricola sp.]
MQGLLIFVVGLAVTSGSLATLHAPGSNHRGAEVVVLTTANLGVTVLRFVAMTLWVFVRRPAGQPDRGGRRDSRRS